jgi:hypothetical protein
LVQLSQHNDQAAGLKTGIKNVVLYLHFLTCVKVKSGTFGDKGNSTHTNVWTALKREEVTESLGKLYKVKFITCTLHQILLKVMETKM